VAPNEVSLLAFPSPSAPVRQHASPQITKQTARSRPQWNLGGGLNLGASGSSMPGFPSVNSMSGFPGVNQNSIDPFEGSLAGLFGNESLLPGGNSQFEVSLFGPLGISGTGGGDASLEGSSRDKVFGSRGPLGFSAMLGLDHSQMKGGGSPLKGVSGMVVPFSQEVTAILNRDPNLKHVPTFN